MKRLLRRIFLLLGLLVVLIVALVIVVQVVLWTDLPRRIVVGQLQDALGLDVQIDRLAVGWSGRTEARGLVVALPLEDDPVFEADALHLSHTALLWMVVGQGFDLSQFEAEAGHLHLRERADGSWNLQEVQQVLAANLSKNAAAAGTSGGTSGGGGASGRGGPLPLPKLALPDITVDIHPWQAGALRLTDIDITAERRGALGYRFEFVGPALGRIEGNLSRAAPHRHEVAFDLAPSPALLAIALRQDDPPALGMRGRWTGQTRNDTLVGTLHIDEAAMPDATAVGSVRVTVAPQGDLTITLDQPALTLNTPNLPPQRVTWRSGRLRLVERELFAERVELDTLDGRAQLDGTFDIEQRVGVGRAVWVDLAYPATVRHSGELDIQLTRPDPVNQRLQVALTTRGSSPVGPWQGQAELVAVGPDWRTFSATLTARDFQLQDEQQLYHVQRVDASIIGRGSHLHVERFDVQSSDAVGRVTGAGEIDLNTRAWSLSLGGRDIHLPGLPTGFDRLSLSLVGDTRQVQLTRARLAMQGLEATVQGHYRPRDAQPVSLRIALEQLPIRVGSDLDPMVRAENLTGQLDVTGTVQPLALRAQGRLLATALRVRAETLGDIELNVRSTIDSDGAVLTADAVEWLDGQWSLSGAYDRRDGRMKLSVDARDLDLTLADRILPQPVGLAMGRVDVALNVTGLAQEQSPLVVEGTFELRDLQRPPLALQQLRGKLLLQRGRLRIYDLQGGHEQGQLTGELSLPIDRPSEVTFQVTLRDWWMPMAGDTLAGVEAWGSGEASGTVDLLDRTGQARADLRGRVAYAPQRIAGYRSELLAEARAAQLAQAAAAPEDDEPTAQLPPLELSAAQQAHLAALAEPLAELNLGLDLAGSVLLVREMRGTLLGGAFDGQATVPLQRLSEAELDVRWQGAALQRLAVLSPVMANVQGAWGGELRVARATDPRPIAPMRMDLKLDASDISYQNLPFGEGLATAYFSRDRFVLQNLRLMALEGEVNLWGRVSQHEGEAFAFLSGSVKDINLATLSTALRPDEPALVGRLTADVTLSAPLRQPELAFGSGSLDLHQSDLANIPLFSLLYDLINIRVFSTEPDGEGMARFRIDHGVVVLDQFRYSNRGGHIELYAFRLHDVTQGLDTPISGYAVLSASLLPQIESLDVLDRALRALQREVTTARLFGTPKEPRYALVPLKGFGQAVGRLLRSAEEPVQEEEE